MRGTQGNVAEGVSVLQRALHLRGQDPGTTISFVAIIRYTEPTDPSGII